ncbi:MAG: ABC transporter permease [Planctomycetota bacterium]
MSKVLRVALRDYAEAVRSKAFLISIVLAPVFMCGGIIAMTLLEGQEDVSDKRVAIIDRTGLIASSLIERAESRNAEATHDLATGKKRHPAYVFEIVPPPEGGGDVRVELSRRVEEKELAGFLEIGPRVVHPVGADEADGMRYYSEGAAFDELRPWIAGQVNERIHSLRLQDAGLDEAAVRSCFAGVPMAEAGLVTIDAETGEIVAKPAIDEAAAFGVPFIALMLLFMMVMTGAVPLIQSTLEEKMQRISEVLLGSVRPFELMMGKLIGSFGVSLTVAFVYLAGGLGFGWYAGGLEHVPLDLLPWFFVHMVAAIFMYGALCSAVGAACNDAKEAQSLTMPIMVPIVLPMMIVIPVIKEPLSSFATGMSLVPFFTPFLMLLRQSTPAGIPAWQPWVGLAGMLAATLFAVWAGGRIFRVGLLMQGKAPRLTDLARWAIRG